MAAAARAEQAAVPVVGFINLGVADASANRVAAFRKGLSEAGYAEGQNVRVSTCGGAQRNGGRRLLHTEERVRALFARMRDELNEMASRHASEVAVLRTELDEIRAQFDELRAVSLARQRAHAELVGLNRERAIQRARAAERDASTPLH